MRRIIPPLVTASLLAALAASALGMVLRDRVAALAALSYAPVPFVAFAAVTWDALRRGRSVPRVRLGLSLAALALAAWHAATMVGWRVPHEPAAGESVLRVMQWNVRWGGEIEGSATAWPAVVAMIAEQRADVLVLSEGPRAERLAALSPLGYAYAYDESGAGSPTAHRVVVAARRPVMRVKRHALEGGVAVEFVVEGERPLRVLAVDGVSAPWRDRRPMMREVAALVRAAGDAGRSYDLLAGDFNVPGRSVGFDELRALGFASAADHSLEWRGTWRMPLSYVDIDHIWIDAAAARVAWCDHVAGPWLLDHRGIVCDVAIAPREARR